jgi:hypothetical protein
MTPVNSLTGKLNLFTNFSIELNALTSKKINLQFVSTFEIKVIPNTLFDVPL